MAEGGSSCPCTGAKKKSGVFKLFRLKKKKKPTCTEEATCIKCLQGQKNVNLNEYTMDAYIEKERMMMAESKRKEPNYVQMPPERKQIPYREDNIPMRSPLNNERSLVQASGSRNMGSTSTMGYVGSPGSMGALSGIPESRLRELPIKYHPQNCSCNPCKKKRYDDSLIAMDAQVILQNSLLSDTAGLVCVIL